MGGLTHSFPLSQELEYWATWYALSDYHLRYIFTIFLAASEGKSGPCYSVWPESKLPEVLYSSKTIITKNFFPLPEQVLNIQPQINLEEILFKFICT